jgi:twitching motility two-component system response regulator PilH
MATVLVVEDEPDLRLFAQINLERAEHRVLTAADGHEGLAIAEREVPDVVLLDVVMPGLDGWEVLRRIKASPDAAVRTVPVVMMTALGGDRDQVQGGVEGAIRYLVKPVPPGDLLDAVRDVVDGAAEPVRRRKVQTESLERLARIEAGGVGADGGPRPRLTRLERHRPRQDAAPPAAPAEPPAPQLTVRQYELLRVLRDAPSVTAAAATLSMSRSNIYASLRRIGRKLGTADVTELLRMLRSGELALPAGP